MRKAKVGSPGRFSAMTMPIAPAVSGVRGLHPVRTPTAADERDGSGQGPPGAALAELAVDARDRPDVDEPLVRGDPCRRDGVGGHEGHARKPARARRPAATLPNTCAFATAPTLIASGAVAGDPAVPRPKKSRSLPAEITGTTPARTTFVTAGIEDVVRGSACGPPPEKLMTSIPSRTAASKAATISGLFAEQQPPSGAARDVEDAVVADVRARRDALDVLHRRMAAAIRLDAETRLARLHVGLHAGDHARDERPVEGAVAIERRAVRTRPGESPRDDHLRRRRPRSLRKAGRVREAGRVEEGVLVVDAVVDDGDLDTLTSGSRQRAELRSAEHRRPAVEVEVVREARVHPGGDPTIHELREPAVRDANREAVDEDLVAARDDRRGNEVVRRVRSPWPARLAACSRTSARRTCACSACASHRGPRSHARRSQRRAAGRRAS